jgi:O6-methylguanine-DNA--protein-cysteine methyltransferase
MEIKLAVVRTELGWIGVAMSPKGVMELELPKANRDAALARLRRKFAGAKLADESVLGMLAEQLRRYAAGKRVDFDATVDLATMTPFQRRVLAVVRDIPWRAGRLRRRAGDEAEAAGARGNQPFGRLRARFTTLIFP